MSSVVFEPFPIYPEYLKSGGGKKNNNNGNSGSAPSGDITLIVSVVEVYSANATYSSYETFITNLFSALQNVSKGDCVDDHDTDPHVSMARGVKFKSSYHMQQYANAANLEVAVWQAMYPYGVIIGSSSSASFPPGVKGKKQAVGYGNMYFFFDRMNITKAFPPSRGLTDDEYYYATLYKKGKASTKAVMIRGNIIPISGKLIWPYTIKPTGGIYRLTAMKKGKLLLALHSLESQPPICNLLVPFRNNSILNTC
jgi:hypothetical protein